MIKKRNVPYLLLIGAVVLLLLLTGAVFPSFIFRFAENRLIDQEIKNRSALLERQEALLRAGLTELGRELKLAHYDALCTDSDRVAPDALEQLRRRVDDSLFPVLLYLDAERTAMGTSHHGLSEAGREGLARELAGPQVAAITRNAILTGAARASGRVSDPAFGFPAFLLAIPIHAASSPPNGEGSDPAPDAVLPGNGDVTPPPLEARLAPRKAKEAEFILAMVDLPRFLRRMHPKDLGEESEWWVLDATKTVLFHPDPASVGKSLDALTTLPSDMADFLAEAVVTPRIHREITRPRTGRGGREALILVSGPLRVGEVELIGVVAQPLAPLVGHLSVVVRGLVLLVLGLFVMLLGMGHVWERLKRHEIREESRSSMSRELEKMVEARTVELNFVTRTIKDLIDSIPSALVVLDRQLNVLLVNLSFYSIFSSRLMNVTGRNITEIFSKDFGERLGKIMHTKDPIIDLEMRKFVEGQGEKVLMVNVLHLLGKRDRLLMVIDDISERKVLERQLIQAEKMSGLGTLMSGIAHEINNPLNAIAGMAQILLARADNDEVKNDAQQILQYVKRVAEIVKELSRYSRSAQVTDTVTADVHSVIEGALNMVTHSRKLKDVQVDKQYAHDLPAIKINVVELEQVFINLITNAVDALDDVGPRAEDPSFVKRIAIVTGLHGGDFVQIVMQDNGPGIAPEHLKKIFDPFFSTKEQGKGTGLGLSICYKIIQRYGGIILVESQVGAGTKFTIRLPVNV